MPQGLLPKPPIETGWSLSRLALVVVLLTFLIGIWFSGWPLPDTPHLSDTAFTDVLSALGTLAILALFVERTVEVYAVSVREPGKVLLENTLAKEQGGTDAALIQGAQSKLAGYQAGTQKRATLFALGLGLLLGLFGVSILGPMFDAADHLGKSYQYLRLLDVIIVGGLLAGGADPIHQMIKVLQDAAELNRANTALTAAETKAAAAQTKAAAAAIQPPTN